MTKEINILLAYPIYGVSYEDLYYYVNNTKKEISNYFKNALFRDIKINFYEVKFIVSRSVNSEEIGRELVSFLSNVKINYIHFSKDWTESNECEILHKIAEELQVPIIVVPTGVARHAAANV